MRAGILRHVVTIQIPTVTKNVRGVEVVTWPTALATVRADVRTLSGRDLVGSDQVTPIAQHQITLRWRADITTKHRVKWGNRYFGIDSVLEPDNRLRSLTLMCTELVGESRGL
jgi:SPP1 family predicted phage head-tail adaptor